MFIDASGPRRLADPGLTAGQRRAAMLVAMGMCLVAVVATTLERNPGHANPGVLAALIGAIVVTELLSGCILFGQFLEKRLPWLAAVGCGYLIVSLTVVGYMLTFPAVFSEAGYFGANRETALTLWCVWHALFPIAVIVGVGLRRSKRLTTRGAGRVVAWCGGLAPVGVAIAVFFCSHFATRLPNLLDARGFTPLMVDVTLPVLCVLDAIALFALWRRRPSSVLELWLPVAVLASMLDAIMGVVAARYSIVWYVGKFFAVTSSSIMVGVFLSEIRLTSQALGRANRELRMLSEHAARHDAITDLPNRAALEERLADALARGSESGRHTALLHVNLDHFGTINEAMGIVAGDALLRETARRLRTVVRGADTLACTGGDGFFIVMRDVERIEDVAARAHATLAALRQSFLSSGHRIFPSASIGIGLAPGDATAVEPLQAAALAAAERAKGNGGNQAQFYQPAMREAAVTWVRMESELRRALQRKQFEVFYQPIVDLASRRIVGAEALLRWKHPRLGLMAPDTFIPLAERNGLIVPIGAEVLDAVAHQVSQWRESGASVGVAVNVSVREFRDPGFLDRVAGTILRYRIPPELLGIEVTESLAIDEAEQTQQTLTACRDLGVKISLDDFGTSHACLANIKRLPIATLKIDKSFIKSVATDHTDATIVVAILALAKGLGLATVAEGIETAEQLDWLRNAGCDYGQGYLFARPLPVGEFTSRLSAQHGHVRRSGARQQTA